MPHSSIPLSRLSQFFFHLHTPLGLGSSDFISQFPAIPSTNVAAIRAELERITQEKHLLHPGLQPLLPDQERCSVVLKKEENEEQTFTPFLLHDTIILDISTKTISQPIAPLKTRIHPQKSSLGQCFLLYLNCDQSDAEFAKDCAKILDESLDLKSEGKLLNSPIWEFSNHEGVSYYIWIISDEKFIAEEVEANYYDHLLHLLSCRAKIEYVVKEAQTAYKNGVDCYNQIEQRLRQISELDKELDKKIEEELACSQKQLPPEAKVKSSESSSLLQQVQSSNDPTCKQIAREVLKRRIHTLEEHLKALPQRSYDLAKCERDLTTHLLTLKTNIENAGKALRDLYAPNPNDNFLQSYLTQDCVTYGRQITHDLQILSPGQRFADQAISSIRGIVELDSQKQQLELEKEEKEREERLQQTLAILGSGLTLSGLASQNIPRPLEEFTATKPEQLQPLPKIGFWFGNITIHALIGVAGTVIVFVVYRAVRSGVTKGIALLNRVNGSTITKTSGEQSPTSNTKSTV